MKLSIIVPVYNVEPYLRRCIDSILAQTFTDFELILVDDGSPDNCPTICDEYALHDERIKVIHKNNEGQATARNEGIKLATGEYIGFVDSDDTISPLMYQSMIYYLEVFDADIVICGIESVDEHKCILKNSQNIEETGMVTKEKILTEFFTRYYKQMCGSVCNKLYKRHIFEKVQFPNGILYEDSYVLIDTIIEADRIAFVKENYYLYLSTRSDSTMHYKYSEKSLHSLLFVEKHNKFFHKSNYQLQADYALEEYLNDFLKHQLMVSLTHKELKGKLPVKMPIFRILVNKRICKMKKIVFLMSYFNAKIALKLCKKYFPECIHKYMKNDLNYDFES